MLDNHQKLSKTTVLLHWLVAIIMISLLSVGVYMAETETYFLYPIHKSIGVLIIIPVVWRVVWRIKNGWPSELSVASALQHTVAKLVHWVLILGTVLMPVSGMLMSGMGGHGIEVFGLELMAMNFNPDDAKEVMPINGALAGLGHEAHEIIGYILIAAVVLHIAGALKHELLDKDGTLRRMFGKEV